MFMQHFTEQMSLEEQIGQLVCVGFSDSIPTPEIMELIQQFHVGNVIFFARNIQNAHQTQNLTNRLQQLARGAGQRYPLLICVDQENGLVRRAGDVTTVFPSNMALGVINSEELAYDIAHATGIELKALGINMNLAPVVDINNNPRNPVIGVRSFSENTVIVSRMARATIKGYRDAGIVTTLKHFPGHGDTTVDSHLGLPVIPHDLQHLNEIELVPFRSGIADGADSIMIAHLSLSNFLIPNLLPKLVSGDVVPSSVSPEIITDLLRGQLGFAGLVITDCLEMNAITNTLGIESAAVRALQAGADIVLISHRYDRQRSAIEHIKAAVANGTLTPERIRQSAERVLRLKASKLSWDTLPTETALAMLRNVGHQHLSARAYELSTTVVRDEENQIPLQLAAEQKLLFIIPRIGSLTAVAEEDQYKTVLLDVLRRRHQQTEVVVIPVAQISWEEGSP